MDALALISLGDGTGRWLALTPEALTEALRRGAALMPAPSARETHNAALGLRDAAEAAAALGVKASWLLAKARLNEIPYVKVGRYPRFDVSAVAQHLAKGPSDQRSSYPCTPPNALKGKG
jgi:excisionase family DNA binding protein